MKIPLNLFPEWTKKQYNLSKLAFGGWVYIEMWRAVWGLPQAGIIANKHLRRKLHSLGTVKVSTRQDFGRINLAQYLSPWSPTTSE